MQLVGTFPDLWEQVTDFQPRLAVATKLEGRHQQASCLAFGFSSAEGGRCPLYFSNAGFGSNVST